MLKFIWAKAPDDISKNNALSFTSITFESERSWMDDKSIYGSYGWAEEYWVRIPGKRQ